LPDQATSTPAPRHHQSLVLPEMSDDDYEPREYKPSQSVENLHSFYHHGSDDFDSTDRSYQLSIGGFFGATVVIGFIFLLFVWVINICSCFKCFQRRCLKWCVFSGSKGKRGIIAMLLLSAIVITFSYVPYSSLVDAAEGLGGTMGDLADIFKTMESSADSLMLQRNNYLNSINDCACPAILANDSAVEFGDASEEMYDMLEGLGADIEDTSTLLTEDLVDYLTMGIGAIVAVYWAVAVFGLVAAVTKCVCDDKLFLLFATIALIAFTLFLGLELMFAVSIADFCYANPDSVIIESGGDAGLPSSAMELVTFYITCEGSNPLSEMLVNATDALETISTTIQDPSATLVCDGSGISSLKTEINNSIGYFGDIEDALSCDSINPLYTEAMYDYVCGDFIYGLGGLWSVQVVASVFLWLALAGFPCATIDLSDYEASIAPNNPEIDEIDPPKTAKEDEAPAKASLGIETAAP